MRKFRDRPCEQCGQITRRPKRVDRPHLCTSCAIGRVAHNAVKLAAFGVAYRAHMAKQAQAGRSEPSA